MSSPRKLYVNPFKRAYAIFDHLRRSGRTYYMPIKG